jgi:cytochrome oxidase Cu insertion factor (SCO1/SenC/PrrC family)
MKPNKNFFHLATFFFLMIQSCTSSDNKDSTDSNSTTVQNDLPQMVVTKSDGSQLNMRELTGKTVLILFQTDCDHCQREAAAIQENITAFKDYSLYFITTTSHKEIETFASEYKLAGHPNVYFCQTTSQSVLDNFGPIDAPSLYIFSPDQKLVKAFNGETQINEILRYIK